MYKAHFPLENGRSFYLLKRCVVFLQGSDWNSPIKITFEDNYLSNYFCVYLNIFFNYSITNKICTVLIKTIPI